MVMFMGASYASVSVIKKDKTEYHQYSVESVNLDVDVSASDEYGLSVSKGNYNELILTRSVTTHLRKFSSFDDYLTLLGYLSYKENEAITHELKELGSGINFITEITFDC
jgi:hypothetical protein